MPKDKTDSHNRIIEAAKAEFMEYGYSDASLRRIAANAGIQVSGLYKHFKNKEDMFESLVGPAMEGFFELYHSIEIDYFSNIEVSDEKDGRYDWESKSESIQAMTYIYDHLDEFKLIILKSGGTHYENFVHEVAKLEEKVTYKYMDLLKEKGYKVKKTDPKEFHLLLTSFVEAMFKPITHGLDRKEALQYAETLEEFYNPAWKEWFGI